MLRFVGRALLIILVIYVVGTGYSYWYSRTRGYVSMYIFDGSKKGNDPISNSKGRFKDSGGALLAEFRSDETGVFYLIHPEVGDCTEAEKRASRSSDGWNEWQKCHEKISKWIPSWIRSVKGMDIEFGKCSVASIPIDPKHYEQVNWLWWVPHPHIGGFNVSTHAISMKINSRDCSY
ncbi:MAG: hypothetical protein ABL958_02560 [Bdellovibrionia bacterium]